MAVLPRWKTTLFPVILKTTMRGKNTGLLTVSGVTVISQSPGNTVVVVVLELVGVDVVVEGRLLDEVDDIVVEVVEDDDVGNEVEVLLVELDDETTVVVVLVGSLSTQNSPSSGVQETVGGGMGGTGWSKSKPPSPSVSVSG